MSSAKKFQRRNSKIGKAEDIHSGTNPSLKFWLANCQIPIAPLRTFTNAARGWLVDADVHRTGGQRREGRIGALLLISTNIAGVATMLTLASIGAFGIDTGKCWGEAQDRGGVTYLKGIFQIGSPTFLLISAFFVWMFPIHGDKLKELEDRQRDYYVKHPEGARGNKVAPS